MFFRPISCVRLGYFDVVRQVVQELALAHPHVRVLVVADQQPSAYVAVEVTLFNHKVGIFGDHAKCWVDGTALDFHTDELAAGARAHHYRRQWVFIPFLQER